MREIGRRKLGVQLVLMMEICKGDGMKAIWGASTIHIHSLLLQWHSLKITRFQSLSTSNYFIVFVIIKSGSVFMLLPSGPIVVIDQA